MQFRQAFFNGRGAVLAFKLTQEFGELIAVEFCGVGTNLSPSVLPLCAGRTHTGKPFVKLLIWHISFALARKSDKNSRERARIRHPVSLAQQLVAPILEPRRRRPGFLVVRPITEQHVW
jgi:hypothetical protein